MTNLFFEITTAERPERRLSHGLIHPVTPFPAEEDPSRIHLAKKRMELELGRQHTLILAHLGHQAKVMGSHHGPAREKKSQDPVGVVDGSFPGMVACQGPSTVVAGVVRNPRICHGSDYSLKAPTSNQASSQMENCPFSPTTMSSPSDPPIAISTIPRWQQHITTHPSPKNAVPASPAPTPLIGTPPWARARQDQLGEENPGSRSTGLRPVLHKPSALAPRRQSGRGSAVLKTNVPS